MNKYKVLVENVEKNIRAFNLLKKWMSDDFVNLLSQTWGCEKDCIKVEFNKPNYFVGNRILTWDFTLVISLKNPDAELLKISLRGFSLMAIVDFDSKKVSPASINYQDKIYKVDEVKDLFESIFQEIQKIIEQGSWFAV